jgi:predicted RNA-binding Zn ribbon-like protein
MLRSRPYRGGSGLVKRDFAPPTAIPHTVSEHACIDFVNSRFADHTGAGVVYDRIDIPEWQRWFTARCGVRALPPPTSIERRELLALRALLRRLLELRRPPSAQDQRRLNRYQARGPAVAQLVGSGAGLRIESRWSRESWQSVMAAASRSYANLLVAGDLERVHVCANPHCTWLFYDDSRNATRRWCDVSLCGNLVRVRRARGIL